VTAAALSAQQEEARGRAWWAMVGRTTIVALAMVLAAYTMAFTHFPPDATFGRMTSVHLAAGIGAAIVVGAVASALVMGLQRWRLGLVGVAMIAVWFADLGQFAISVQLGLVVAGQEQRNLWTRVLQICPDIGPGTFVALDDQVGTDTWYEGCSSWADTLVFPTLFRVPPGVTQPHFVSRLWNGDWRDRLQWRGDRLFWKKKDEISPYWGFDETVEVPQGNTILLHQQWLKFSREEGTIQIGGRPLQLKPKPTTRSTIPFEHGTLYKKLILEGELSDSHGK
jgi:hypothetical protein